MKNNKAENLIGCCGLYCGLCSKYQSRVPSRCIGCRLAKQHSWCSIWNCCVKKHGFENCAECREVFKCPIFLRRKVTEWIPAVVNLRQIKEFGLNKWLKEQIARQALVEKLLHDFNEGRSMSFYCKVCARMPIDLINKAMKEAKEKLENENRDTSDMKIKAAVLKTIIKDLTLKSTINLA